MIFDWEEFYYQAIDLSANRNTTPADQVSLANQADFRTAMSRAYYAAYHKAKAFLEVTKDPTLEIDEGGVHERLISRFTQNSLEDRRIMGAKLARIKTIRVVADYKEEIYGNIYSKAKIAIDTSKELINEFESVVNPGKQPKIP
jgi:uncharacterized protein (UPF0332 family)